MSARTLKHDYIATFFHDRLWPILQGQKFCIASCYQHYWYVKGIQGYATRHRCGTGCIINIMYAIHYRNFFQSLSNTMKISYSEPYNLIWYVKQSRCCRCQYDILQIMFPDHGCFRKCKREHVLW